MKRIAILGAGGMGTALAVLFARSARSVQALGTRPRARRPRSARTRENARHLPGVLLPENVGGHARTPATPPAAADLIVVAVPSAYLRATLDGDRRPAPAGRARS